MSSTNQSAESCVANGLTLNINDIDIMAPKLNKSGGKSANVLYKPTKKGLYISMQVPMLTWGASMFKDQQSGKETFDLSIQFPRKDYSTPETDKLLSTFQELENKIKSEAIKNSMSWFNRKTMTHEVVEALWTPMLKYTKDPETGEADMTKAPTLKVKLPCWEGKFNCEIYDPNRSMLYPDERTGATPLELIPKGVNIIAIVQCGGLWFANGKFGCTWRLFQAIVQPKPSMKGRCLIDVTPTAKQALAQSVSQSDESSLVIEDDSDFEGEREEEPMQVKPVPVPVVKQEPVPVQVTEPVAVQVAVPETVQQVTVPSTPAPAKKVVKRVAVAK